MVPKRKTYIQNCTGDNCQIKPKNKVFSRVLFYLLTLFFIGVLVYILIFSPYLEISNIKIIGTSQLDNSSLQQLVVSFNQGKYLKYIPRDNYLLVSQSNIENLLKDNFKKIRSVNITKRFPNNLEIKIEERKALIIWCSLENCFLVDEKGTAYAQADFSSNDIMQNNLIKIIDASNHSLNIRDNVMDEDLIEYITSIKDILKEYSIDSINEYVLPSRVADEVDVRTAQGFEIYLSTQFPLENAAKNLGAVLKKEIPNTQKNDLTYIDLRTENKVFYKLNTPKIILDSEQILSNEEDLEKSNESKDKTKKN